MIMLNYRYFPINVTNLAILSTPGFPDVEVQPWLELSLRDLGHLKVVVANPVLLVE